MLPEIRLLAVELGIDGPVLLLMAREAAGNSRLRCVEDLNSAGLRSLLSDLREIQSPRLLAA